MSLIKSVDMVAKVGLFRPVVAKETLENKMRRLRREYKADKARAIALNTQAIAAIKIQIAEDNPVQKRIRELEKEQAELKAKLTPEVQEVVTPKLPEIVEAPWTLCDHYLNQHSKRMILAQKHNDKRDWAIHGRPFWKVED